MSRIVSSVCRTSLKSPYLPPPPICVVQPFMNSNIRNCKANSETYLEVLFHPGLYLIGSRILNYLNPADIFSLRQTFSNEQFQDLILNDVFFLFHNQIAPFLLQEAQNRWSIIIQKTVLKLPSKRAALKTSKILCDILFPLKSELFYQNKYLRFSFHNPLKTLIYNQSLGGARILYLIDRFCTNFEKRLLFDYHKGRHKSALHIVVQCDYEKLFPLFTKLVTPKQLKYDSLLDIAIRYRSKKILKIVRRHDSKSFYRAFGMPMKWFYL